MKHFYNLLKKSAVLIVFFTNLIFPEIVNGQYWMEKFGYLGNYYNISDSTEWWFNQDTSRINNKDFGYKSYARWKTFLEPRVDQNGTLNTYAKAFSGAIDAIKVREQAKSASQWESLGPISSTINSMAYQGIVTSIYVNPTNPDNIYAGGGTGGLFVTTDEGKNWKCLTDGIGIPGIESIEMNPAEPNVIYIGTGFYTWGREYSFGVMKSKDNGLTWYKTGLNKV